MRAVDALKLADSLLQRRTTFRGIPQQQLISAGNNVVLARRYYHEDALALARAHAIRAITLLGTEQQ